MLAMSASSCITEAETKLRHDLDVGHNTSDGHNVCDYCVVNGVGENILLTHEKTGETSASVQPPTPVESVPHSKSPPAVPCSVFTSMPLHDINLGSVEPFHFVDSTDHQDFPLVPRPTRNSCASSLDSEVERIYAKRSSASPHSSGCHDNVKDLCVETELGYVGDDDELIGSDEEDVIITEYVDVEIVEETETVTVIESVHHPAKYTDQQQQPGNDTWHLSQRQSAEAADKDHQWMDRQPPSSDTMTLPLATVDNVNNNWSVEMGAGSLDNAAAIGQQLSQSRDATQRIGVGQPLRRESDFVIVQHLPVTDPGPTWPSLVCGYEWPVTSLDSEGLLAGTDEYSWSGHYRMPPVHLGESSISSHSTSWDRGDIAGCCQKSYDDSGKLSNDSLEGSQSPISASYTKSNTGKCSVAPPAIADLPQQQLSENWESCSNDSLDVIGATTRSLSYQRQPRHRQSSTDNISEDSLTEDLSAKGWHMLGSFGRVQQEEQYTGVVSHDAKKILMPCIANVTSSASQAAILDSLVTAESQTNPKGRPVKVSRKRKLTKHQKGLKPDSDTSD